jgi:hypothetical protein
MNLIGAKMGGRFRARTPRAEMIRACRPQKFSPGAAGGIETMYPVLYWSAVTLLTAWILFAIVELIRGF